MAGGGQARVGFAPEACVSGRSKERGRRWGADEAREVIAQWRRSGQSASAFARVRGFSTTRLSYWAKRLSSDATVRFVPIAVDESAARSRAVLEVEHGGVKLRVREDLGVDQVGQLCAALVRAVRAC
jgi:transposase-like protein